jgi:hypothetical protein
MAILLLLLTIRLQGANAWQLGWMSTASVDDYGVGSEAAVMDGLNCSGCYFLANSAFYDLNDIWHTVFVLDENDGSTVGAEAEAGFSSCTDSLCHYVFEDCGTMSTDTYYAQENRWISADDGYVATDSACTDTYTAVEVGATPGVGEYDGYNGGVDMMESESSGNFFADAAAYAIWDPSLEYVTSGGTWYTAADTWVAPLDNGAPTGSGSPGADYSCSTPWLLLDSGFGGPWSDSSTPSCACTG